MCFGFETYRLKIHDKDYRVQYVAQKDLFELDKVSKRCYINLT